MKRYDLDRCEPVMNVESTGEYIIVSELMDILRREHKQSKPSGWDSVNDYNQAKGEQNAFEYIASKLGEKI
jgi:hypothetical protein